MTPQAIQRALDIMKARGISHDDAMLVLEATAVELHKSARLAKAAARNVSVEVSDAFDTGKALGAAINARFGYGGKS